MPVKNIVLVHGAWADGSCWWKIIPQLQAKGLRVSCTQNPLTSIAEDVKGANRIINAQDGPVLLVGHSYGGTIITEAGNNPKVAGLVYVAAFAPDEGETMTSLSQPYGATPLFSEITPIEDGFLRVTEKGISEAFAQDLSADEKSIVFATQGAFQGAIFGTRIGKAAWHNRPNWFVVAANDRAIAPEQQKATAKRMGAKVLAVPTSHLAMLAQPEQVATFLQGAAASVGEKVAAA
jgi:pimeloyl-ACP methyl ester carboxylesterase